ncbi:MAG TPA: ABC transporter permease [Rhizobiaceae bacterium]|nr:ABC transporter permease [Rhizobiaceae bacterium]
MLKKDLGLLILVVIVSAIVAFLNPRFISPINLSNTANLVGLFGIFSIGEGFVIITGGIDLSIGSMLALLGVVFIDLLTTYQMNWVAAVLLIVLAGTALGAIQGFLITKMRMQPFIVTLCGLLLYRGIARWYTDDGTAGFAFGQSFPSLEWLTTGRVHGIPLTFVVFVLISIVMGIVLHRSVFGRHLFAVGRNEEAALYSGIRSQWVIAATYIILGALSGLSAIYFAMYTRSISPASHGTFYELYAIAAAVLGGCSLRGGEGSVFGIVLGTILLQVLQNLVNLLGIPSSLNFAVMGAVILLGVLADQQLVNYRSRRAALRSQKALAAVDKAATV